MKLLLKYVKENEIEVFFIFIFTGLLHLFYFGWNIPSILIMTVVTVLFRVLIIWLVGDPPGSDNEDEPGGD